VLPGSNAEVVEEVEVAAKVGLDVIVRKIVNPVAILVKAEAAEEDEVAATMRLGEVAGMLDDVVVVLENVDEAAVRRPALGRGTVCVAVQGLIDVTHAIARYEESFSPIKTLVTQMDSVAGLRIQG
jgi:hypothetical protein